MVDGALKNEIRTGKEPVRALHLTTGLALGAALDRKDGFVGCLRALLLSGRPVDLRSYAARGMYPIYVLDLLNSIRMSWWPTLATEFV